MCSADYISTIKYDLLAIYFRKTEAIIINKKVPAVPIPREGNKLGGKQNMKLLRSGQKGFTLIELLVVIAILGTLAAVVILNVTQFIGQGRNQAMATELHNVQTAVAAYMYDHDGTVPASMDVLSPYFLGEGMHGTYSIDASTGKVTQTAYP